MTRDDALQAWRAMGDREKDAAVARDVMGERVRPRPGLEPCIMPGGHEPWKVIPHYTADHAAAYAVEEKIAEMGLIRQYISTLGLLPRLCDVDKPWDWLRIHASPAQRCCAAWVTCKGREQP